MFLLLLFVLIAAVVNVPWALTRMRSRTTRPQVQYTLDLEGADAPKSWPAATPHHVPWPAPDAWHEGGLFGCRLIQADAWISEPSGGQIDFQMEVEHLGWPYPVIEVKQMWWDWNNPKLAGPETDPAPSLKLQGLILNPLIVGGAAWGALVLPANQLELGRKLVAENRIRKMTDCNACHR